MNEATLADAVLLVHAAATWAMVGLIWFVQVVHYPLFDGVGADGFVSFQQRHMRQTTWVVVPLMFAELGTALALLGWSPAGVGKAGVWAGLVLLLLVWASTFVLQVPRHAELSRGFERDAHRGLVLTNWLRTAVWTLRGVLVVFMLWQAGAAARGAA